MSETPPASSFGVRAAAAPGPAALLELEQREDRSELLAPVDDLLGSFLVRALQGGEVLRVTDGELPLSVPELSEGQGHALDEHFSVASQHAKGAWYLPEQATIKAGLQNLAFYFATYPRFATGITFQTRVRVPLAQSSAGVLAWSATEPLFEQLVVPFDLRGRSAGTKTPEEQLAAWAGFDEIVCALGLELADELAVMRYGGGWGPLRAAAQLEAKQRLLASLAAQATPVLAARYRAHRLRPLIARYYEKAKNGVAKRRQVVTRDLQKDLSAFFGGDWPAFVRYLGEQPHPDEHIDTTLPEVKLMVAGAQKAATVAQSLGLPAEEVERALSLFHGSAPAQRSPVEERVAILRDYWEEFDVVHATQAPGMRPLTGLVRQDPAGDGLGWEWYTPGVHRDHLSAELCARIEAAWGTVMLPRWPEHIVSSISPQATMAATFGPALTFWHGIGLTSWLVSEGPYSRTDMAGLRDYDSALLADLEALGCPVNDAMFRELAAAEDRLGPPEPIISDRSSSEVVSGLRVEFSAQYANRRAGFEGLRDVVTRWRRAWAEKNLDTYLRARWDVEIREAARLYFQTLADRQKPPTAKQFARHAVDATNHWFGGNLSAFFSAIGEKSPVAPERVALMPAEPKAFARLVFERLGGRPPRRARAASGQGDGEETQEERAAREQLRWLSNQSLHLIQLEEAIGHPPELSTFGRQGFEYRSDVLAPDPEAAWARYIEVVDAARVEAQSGPAARWQASAPAPPPPAPTPPSPAPAPAPAPQPTPSAAQPWPPPPPPAQGTGPPPPPPLPAKRHRWFGRDD